MSEQPKSNAQLFLFAGNDRSSVRDAAVAASSRLASDPAAWLALQAPEVSRSGAAAVLAVVADDAAALAARLDRAIERLGDERCKSLRDAAGAYYESKPQGLAGSTAVLFPGEGAPYLGMVGDLFERFPELEEVRTLADELSEQAGLAGPTSRFFHMPSDEDARQRLSEELKALDATMSSVLAADWVLHRILQLLGVEMHAAGGHSAGEIAALTSAGAISDAQGATPISAAARSLAEVDVGGGSDAGLLALGARESVAEELISAAGVGGLEAEPGRRAFVAMRNCPHQTIVVGDASAVDAVEAEAKRRSVMFERLSLGRPYHTPLFEPYAGPLKASFDGMAFHRMQTPVYSCTTGRPFPDDPEEIRQLALAHWSSPVAFSDMVENMHSDGVRVFIEAGPRGNLTSFVQDILRGKEAVALSTNSHVRDGWTHLLHFAAQLAAHRVPFDAARLMPCAARSQPEESQQEQPVAGESPSTPSTNGADGSSFDLLPPVDACDGLARGDAAFGGAAPSEQVMAEYFRVMDQFLDAQQSVMQSFLEAGGAATADPAFFEATAPLESFEQASCDANDSAVAPAVVGFDETPSEPTRAAPPRPLMGEIVERVPGERIVMRRRLDLAEDLYAGEHTVGGRSISRIDPDQHGLPVAPMTFSLELMAEVAEALFPDKLVAGMRDVCLYRWLAFSEEPTQIEVRGSVKKRYASELGETIEVALEIRELGEQAQGPGDGITSKGVVVVADERPAAPPPEEPLADGSPCSLPINTLYNNLFHGPMFIGVESLDRISGNGIQATCRTGDVSGVFRSNPTPNFIINPILLDIVLHPMAGWHLEQPDQAGRILLPYEVGRMELFDDSPAVGSAVQVTGRMESGTHRRFSHSAVAESGGSAWLRMTGLKCWRFYLPFGDVNFHGPKDVYFLADEWPEAESEVLRGAPLEAGEVCCVRLAPPEDLSQTALQDAGAQVMLSPREMETYRAMVDQPKRRFEWLFGRAAAKDAVRILWRRMTGERLFMSDVEILTDEHGRPYAVSRDADDVRKFPSVAISHTQGLIVAAASITDSIGVDVERVAPREPSFEQVAFDDTERALLDEAPGDRNGWIARFWCAKEAAGKATGLGLIDGPRGAAVRRVDHATGAMEVELRGKLAASAPEYAEQALDVRTMLCDELASAITVGGVAEKAGSVVT